MDAVAADVDAEAIELPCVTCRRNMAEHGTAYCDDCLDDERLLGLFEAGDDDRA
jgi:hypothetical protein